LAKARLGEQDCNAAVLGSILTSSTVSLLRAGRNYYSVSKIKSQDVRRPFLSKKNNSDENL
jgi:hypothetical protein